jgi:multidrug efflux pump subunit AcrA (membrane-fusion protein)
MKKFLSFFINTLYFLFVIALALAISTIALTKKVNQSKAYVNNLKGSVVKEKVVVLTLTRGIIDTLYVKNGQIVKKGDIIVKMSNPVLESNYKVYQQRTNNESAQTQANIAKVSLENLTIKAPVDGVVGELYAAEGSSVDEFSKIIILYSSDDIRLQADLTAEQYQRIQKLAKVTAYNTRLNQSFVLKPGLLKAEEKSPTGASEKKIGLYFTFENDDQAAALVNNEDLTINLEDDTHTRKPVDLFIDFWNGLLARNG